MKETEVYQQSVIGNYALYNGDCFPVLKNIPDNSIGFTVFSVPFAELYTYSSDIQDMGNSKSYRESLEHHEFVIPEIERTLMAGRICAVHCMDVPLFKGKDGVVGVRDFPGDLIKLYEKHGFIQHSSRITIWKDPVLDAVIKKVQALAYGQIEKDSSSCRIGNPDYVLLFRKNGGNRVPVVHGENTGEQFADYEYFGNNPPSHQEIVSALGRSPNKGMTYDLKKNHLYWQRYASPIWMDVRQTNTLQKTSARAAEDEKHICPLQLDTIARCALLYSNPNDIILSPYAGIGSEIYQSLLMFRKGIGIELKESYYNQMVLNCAAAIERRGQGRLFR